MKKILFGFLILMLVCSCSIQSKISSPEELVEVEREFSRMSEEEGMKQAFTHFCHEEGVLLRADSYPIIGRTEVMAGYAEVQDSLFQLTWEALDARMADSGDLGYTYGTYLLDYHSEEMADSKGTYVTIWMKDKNGDWKFVLDTGQEGLGED